jgi:AraC-like DNA-binding protein
MIGNHARKHLVEVRHVARRAVPASTAAYDVGYQSVPQFTREYRRMFGMPPVRDAASARALAYAA